MKRVFVPAVLASLAASGAAAQGAGDPAAGAIVFRICRTCHEIGDTAHNFVGPELNGVVGRKAGTVAGYNYSDANRNFGFAWDEATLAKYLKDPLGVMPGGKMAFPGLQSDQEVANVIAYLKEFGRDGKRK